MKRKSRTENEATSLSVEAMVSNKSSKRFQDLASLKILKRRNPLRAVITLPVFFFPVESNNVYAIMISTRLPITISRSKVLNHDPLKKLLTPKARNFMRISTTKMAVKR